MGKTATEYQKSLRDEMRRIAAANAALRAEARKSGTDPATSRKNREVVLANNIRMQELAFLVMEASRWEQTN